MNRRDVLAAAVGLATISPLNEVLAARPCPPTLPGTRPVTCPPISGALQWDWDVPSLQDETDFYRNVMGWTIPSGADSYTSISTGGYPWNASSTYSFGDIHSSTEGDALWAWNQNLKRHGVKSVGNGSTTQDWNDDLLAYFKNNLLSNLDSREAPGKQGTGFGYDHLYGQGLATIYNDTGDAEILPVLTGVRTRLESVSQYRSLAAGGTISVSTYLARGVARWAIVTAFAAEATGDPAWIAMRDNLARAYETAPDWEEGGNIQNGGGNYFASSAQSGFDKISGYSDGRRYQSSFSMGLAVEAVWRLYVQTGSAILRDRLIKMARYIEYYAHDPAWVYPNVGGRFGHEGDGSHFHNSPGDGTATNAAKDCSYDMALINGLVIGYKLTGDTALLTRAQVHFERGNRYDPGGSRTLWAPIGQVHKYVDLQCDLNRNRFQFNKGQLQYCYLIFENGGNPTVIT